MEIKGIKDFEKALRRDNRELIGVGVTAFSRIVPLAFAEGYSIIAYRDSLDLAEIRRYCPVLSLQDKGSKGPPSLINAATILSEPYVQDLLKRRKGEICLLVYQSYPELEDLAGRSGWKILAAPSRTRRGFEDKIAFRHLLKSLKLPWIPGEIIALQSLSEKTYQEMVHRYGERLVFQLPEVKRGGGRGTFFIDSTDDFRIFLELIKGGTLRGDLVSMLCITRRLFGIPASVAGCQTRWGTLISDLQVQLIDIPDVLSPRKGNGFFCGHDWHLQPFSKGQQKKATGITKTIGRALQNSGYRGIFGIDFIADPGGEWLFPVECNPRFTGAFPMLSLLHLKEGIVPMDVYHILEFLNGDYEIDPDRVSHDYQTGLEGSHLILFNPGNGPARVDGDPKPGCFRFDKETGKGRFLHPGLDYRDLPAENDVLITDGLPGKGKFLADDELYRICRLLFSGSVAETPHRLGYLGKAARRWAYDQMAISSIL